MGTAVFGSSFLAGVRYLFGTWLPSWYQVVRHPVGCPALAAAHALAAAFALAAVLAPPPLLLLVLGWRLLCNKCLIALAPWPDGA